MVFESVVFAAGMVLIACAIISGLYLLCHHAGQSEGTKPPKTLLMSDFNTPGQFPQVWGRTKIHATPMG